MNYRFEFTLEDATQDQAELLLEMVCAWADHRNCWIAGGYHRIGPDAGEEVKDEEPGAPGDTGTDPGPDNPGN